MHLPACPPAAAACLLHDRVALNAHPARQCFNHFSLYLKGREELVVTVYHGALTAYTPPPLARITISG
jgi:hypothetical protein